jgi:hypothetical protein
MWSLSTRVNADVSAINRETEAGIVELHDTQYLEVISSKSIA